MELGPYELGAGRAFEFANRMYLHWRLYEKSGGFDELVASVAEGRTEFIEHTCDDELRRRDSELARIIVNYTKEAERARQRPEYADMPHVYVDYHFTRDRTSVPVWDEAIQNMKEQGFEPSEGLRVITYQDEGSYDYEAELYYDQEKEEWWAKFIRCINNI